MSQLTQDLTKARTIDWTEGTEVVYLDEAAMATYREACRLYEAALDACDDVDRDDYAVNLTVTMEVVDTGERYTRDDLTFRPGELQA